MLVQSATSYHRALPTEPCCAKAAPQPLTTAEARRIAAPAPPAVTHRRAWLAAGAAAALAPLVQAARPLPALAEGEAAKATGIGIVADEPGMGMAAARQGDLVLVHYVGTTASGDLFDSTRGGAMYRDGGKGALRPAIIRLGGSPVPGICEGLQLGIQGMRVGGKRTFTVPASLGFGGSTVLGPYGIVPGGSVIQYEVELLRLSRRGPDALMSGISQCGGGFVNERTTGCADITPAEFV